MPGLPLAKPVELGLSDERLNQAYGLLTAWTTGEKPVMPGAALAVGRKGKQVETRFFGRMGPEPDAPALRRDAQFLMASITKPMVYTAGLMQVEQGKLNLSDKVARLLPDFAAHHKEEVQVHHLFTHTSGLPDMPPNNTELRRRHAPLSKFIEVAIRDTMPLFPPGEGLSYQSMGTLVVAELVQQLTGEKIDDHLRRVVFTPLGLESTALGSKGLDETRLVRVQTPDYQGQSDFNWNSRYWRELGSPWGGMFSTPDDFAVVCQTMLQYGRFGDVRLLSPETARLMTTNRLDAYPKLPEAIRRTQPWGLGWRLNHWGQPDSWSDLLAPHVFGHTGSTGNMVWMDRERDGFMVLLTTALRAAAPWRLVQVSNAVAAAFV